MIKWYFDCESHFTESVDVFSINDLHSFFMRSCFYVCEQENKVLLTLLQQEVTLTVSHREQSHVTQTFSHWEHFFKYILLDSYREDWQKRERHVANGRSKHLKMILYHSLYLNRINQVFILTCLKTFSVLSQSINVTVMCGQYVIIILIRYLNRNNS